MVAFEIFIFYKIVQVWYDVVVIIVVVYLVKQELFEW